MKKIFKFFQALVEHKISLKELYFSFTSWFIILVTFLGFSTKFYTSLWISNIIIALSVYVVVILITNRILLSGFLTLLLAVCFDYIKLIKWQFLMQDLSAADVFMLNLLINHGLLRLIYEYATKEIYLIILLLFINFILLWNKYDILLDNKKLGIQKFYTLRFVSFGVAILLVSKLFYVALDKTSYFYQIIESTKSQTQYYPRKVYGPFADILFTLKDIYIKPKPGNVDSSLVTNEVSKELSQCCIYDTNEMPDIVVILNESTFNPNKLDYDFADKLKFLYFTDGIYTKYSGIMNVNTYGGSSWISEYEINTGIPHKSFIGPSYMPFITLAPLTNQSIMSYLRSIGYRVEVLYPVDKNFSFAQEAYIKLGSHNVTDIYDYGFKPQTWGNVPDQMIADMIIDTLNKYPEHPKYIFASTMLNHGPHSSFFSDSIGCSQTMHDTLCSKLNDYITRLYMTEKDQLNLIQKLMNRKKKTIIVNFGDHLPSFEGFSTQLRFTRDIKDYYKTFYHINANFEIQDTNIYPNLDIEFIPGLILDIAKLNGNTFYQANSFIRKRCHGTMSSCHGKNKETDRILESYKSLIVKQLGF